MKIWRRLLTLVIIIILVIAVMVAALMLFVNPNKFKPMLIKSVKAHTGYDLVIDQPLSWSFYPYFSVLAPHMLLQSSTTHEVFIDLRDVHLATGLNQLLHGTANLQGKAYINDVFVNKIHWQSVSVTWQWQNQVLTLSPIKAKLYSGQIEANVSGEDFSSLPIWRMSVNFADVQLANLLTDLRPDAKLKVNGLASGRLSLRTVGNTRDELISRANGQGVFNLAQGRVIGIDLNYLVQTAGALLHGQPIAFTNTQSTAFDRVTANFLIKNGLLITNNLLLNSSAFLTSGKGYLGLANQKIHLALLVNAKQKQQWQIPVNIGGTVQEPKISVNVHDLERLITSNVMQKIKQNAQSNLPKKLPANASQFINHLLR